MGDHDDHIHVGYTPVYGPGLGSVSKQFDQILKPEQWERLIDRLGEIENPTVPTKPSDVLAARRQATSDRAKTRTARLQRPPSASSRRSRASSPSFSSSSPARLGLDDGRYLCAATASRARAGRPRRRRARRAPRRRLGAGAAKARTRTPRRADRCR